MKKFKIKKIEKKNNKNEVKKRIIKTMDRILIIMGIFLFLYIIAILTIYCIFGTYPETMTHDIIYGCLGEGGIMGIIKVVNTVSQSLEKKYVNNNSIDETTNELDNESEIGYVND